MDTLPAPFPADGSLEFITGPHTESSQLESIKKSVKNEKPQASPLKF